MHKTTAFLKKNRWPLTGALLGALVFVVVYGVRVLDPTSVDWILNNPSPDPSQHYLGWAFFRSSPWRLPYLGANYSVVYPYRTSILFTDSIPLLALLCKLLSPVLPATFQYFGWWGLVSYALQGGLAQAIVARLGGVKPGQTVRCWATVAAAGVLVLFPALTIRMFAHTALAANWLVLLAFWLWLRSDELLPRTGLACLAWGGMGLLCAGIHLYYLPMVGLVLVGYAVRRLVRRQGVAAALLPIPVFCAAALAELVLLGAFAANFAGYSNGYLSGANLLNLVVPGLAASWEQNIYMGAGAVLALVLAVAGVAAACARGRGAAVVSFVRRHRGWLGAGALVLVLDLAAAMGNEITLGGKTLIIVNIPQVLMDLWSMFSSCARLAWLAGMVLALAACGVVLRVWGDRAAALLLTVCALVQAWSMGDELVKRFGEYHDPARYADQTLLTDPAWEQLAADGRFTHLAFASFDFEHDEFWDLAAFAADHGWTSNSFYMGHMDGNLAAVTLAGEMNELSSDTLYVFVDEDQLARQNFALHYYRLDGLLIGSVEPLELDPDPDPGIPAHAMDLRLADVTGGSLTAAGVELGSGGQMLTGAWMLFPGSYQVTLTGSGFDHSYIYARHGLINQETTTLDIEFTGIAPDTMTFTFTTGTPLFYWRVGVHTLDDTPLTVTDIMVEKTG